ncbi:uncharacterized protein LOC108907755 [Anoplophora glabripennis]|uniref:uncharacterized protein LOC108907755 n=1 Tax=Anoplophora glabripennis TaxID=217634 RepID=UPI00087531D1|nr:uncharacterized protein LOC108907755 [Anoplophora glabripennis]
MLDNLKGQPLHFKTYDCLCDIYITYMSELLELTKTVKQMENLKMVIKDEQLQNVLVSFLEKYVISNATMPLSERRSYIVKYISLAHINILSFKCLGNIFRYYHTYNKEYGHMIESSLSDIANSDEITFFIAILYSLTIVYEMIVNKYGVVVLTTPEAKSLKLLIKQFLNLKEFKSPRRHYVQLLCFAINYSLKDKSKYSFFYFVHYFVDLLTEDNDRTAVLNFLKEKVPKKAEKNDAVLFLANHLQKVKSGTSSEKPKVTNIPKENKENVNPKKKLKAPRRGGRPVLGKKPTTRKTKSVVKKTIQRNVDTETDVSDDVTIVLDSETDDLEESLTALRV